MVVIRARYVDIHWYVVIHVRRHGVLGRIRIPLDGVAEVCHGRQCAGHGWSHVAGIRFGRGHGVIGLGRAVGSHRHLIGRRVLRVDKRWCM